MTFTKHFFLFTFEISKASMLLSIEDVWVKTKENSYPVYILTRFLYCLYVESLNTCWWLCNPFLEFSLILEIYFLGVNTFCLVFALLFLEVFFRVNSPINKEQRKRWQCQKKMHCLLYFCAIEFNTPEAKYWRSGSAKNALNLN